MLEHWKNGMMEEWGKKDQWKDEITEREKNLE
jgi:hypothetical protein